MMAATVIDLDSRRKVWRVIKGHCRSCHAEAVSAMEQGCPLDHAECFACGAYAFAVTHYEVAGKLVRRMEALS
jgi:hypothetical protein